MSLKFEIHRGFVYLNVKLNKATAFDLDISVRSTYKLHQIWLQHYLGLNTAVSNLYEN